MRDLADTIVDIARAAAAEILAVRARGMTVREKDDRSPVTDADEAANRLIVDRLSAAAPDIPIIAEESVAEGHIPEIGDRFWLVDPLDGTREFVAGRDEFTVNIALIEQGRPVLGVVGVPVRGEIYLGVFGDGAWYEAENQARQVIRARQVPASGPVAVATRSHGNEETDAWLKDQDIRESVRAGSSVKFCLIAAGKADVYPRFGRTMEWDTAAGHAVLLAAGGSVRTLDGTDLMYGKEGLENPNFIARGLSSKNIA